MISRFIMLFGFAVLACCSQAHGQVVTGDAARGEQVLREQGCQSCHLANNQSETGAQDLGRRRLHPDTPFGLAATIWNHAVGAWDELGAGNSSEKSKEKTGSPEPIHRYGFRVQDKPQLNENDMASLFAYFASRRYFEPLGDAKRGKQVFAARGCAVCHGISNRLSPEAKPVAEWQTLNDPIALVQAMWNEPSAMAKAHVARQMPFPKLDSQELTDLLLYLKNLPPTRGKEERFILTVAEDGRDVVGTPGCADCHSGKLAIENRTGWLGMADIVAALWNHQPAAPEKRSRLSYADASEFIGYMWSVANNGDARRGSRIFAAKNCTSCHSSPGMPDYKTELTPSRSRGAFPAVMMKSLFNDGLSMQGEMQKKGMTWPSITGKEMADLEAFLKATPGALKVAHDPASRSAEVRK
jgi:cytochrome c2